MELEPIGRIEDPKSIDKEPLIVPIITYNDKKKEVVTKIKFVAYAAPGVERDMIRAVNPSTGIISALSALDYIDACVHDDDREKWDAFIRDTDFTTKTVLALYTALTEHYANRPFTKPSGSRGGPSSTKRTTPAGANSRASRANASV